MLCAAAFLAAPTAGPVSQVLFILELTRQISGLVAPVALAVAGSVLTAGLLETGSVNSCRIHLARDAAERAGGMALFTAGRSPRSSWAAITRPSIAGGAARPETGPGTAGPT